MLSYVDVVADIFAPTASTAVAAVAAAAGAAAATVALKQRIHSTRLLRGRLVAYKLLLLLLVL